MTTLMDLAHEANERYRNNPECDLLRPIWMGKPDAIIGRDFVALPSSETVDFGPSWMNRFIIVNPDLYREEIAAKAFILKLPHLLQEKPFFFVSCLVEVLWLYNLKQRTQAQRKQAEGQTIDGTEFDPAKDGKQYPGDSNSRAEDSYLLPRVPVGENVAAALPSVHRRRGKKVQRAALLLAAQKSGANG